MATINRQRRLLWRVIDPRGIPVICTQDIWEEHVAYRPELAEYFEEVKLTVQKPDEVYFDPVSTRRKAPGIKVYWYYKAGLTRGHFSGNLVAVVVKVVPEPDGIFRGYMQSALLPHRRERRLILEWPG